MDRNMDERRVSDVDVAMMRIAVEATRESAEEPGRTSPAPRVGVVIARDGAFLGSAHRGETGPGDHGEFGLLEKKLAGLDLAGTTIYTTLEPCSTRNHPKEPCATRLIERGVTRVFIATYDPCPSIYRRGWRMLRDAGIDCMDFLGDPRAEVEGDNAVFLDVYRVARGNAGSVWFDYWQNGGRFRFDTEACGVFETRGTPCSSAAVYAYDSTYHVAHARYAISFDEVYDPSNSDFGAYTLPLNEGNVGIFRNDQGYLLVLIEEVTVPELDPGYPSVRMSFEARAK
jgi:pyrimidine deaminase RibD-like protein